jgi:hypothetical protein
MNTIHRLLHLARLLAAGAGALLVLAVASPAMAGTARVPHYPPTAPPAQAPAPIHTLTAGGMPGWQIVLIAAGTALLAAVLAVSADRVRASRRHVAAPSL